MLKKLDWFIIKKYLTTAFFILGVIMALAIIFDVSERIDDFVEKQAPLKEIIFDYYLNFVAVYSNLFSGLIIFLAVIFFTSKMASHSEIIAILTGGVSFFRLLWPYFIAASILFVCSLYMAHYVIPKANKVKIDFENKYLRHKINVTRLHTHIAINDSTRYYFERFSLNSNTGSKFSIEQYHHNLMTYKCNANSFKYDTTNNKWKLINFTERWFDGIHEKIEKGFEKDTTLPLHPSEFRTRNNIVSTMGPKELNTFIEEEREKGSSDVVFYELEKHQRTSSPFTIYILTFIGVVIGSRKVRGGTGLHLAVGLGFCLAYILLIKVTMVMATNAGLSPFFAVWTPNIVFIILSYFIYQRAQK